jgi:hypothetical protein
MFGRKTERLSVVQTFAMGQPSWFLNQIKAGRKK